MNYYEYHGGWIAGRRGTFQWVCIPISQIAAPCYMIPYSGTDVPIGIDGLEFV